MSLSGPDGRVQLCQRAFLEIEHDCTRTFTSFDVDTKERDRARLYYDQARQTVLRAVDWNFAREISVPQLLTGETTEDDFPYVYNLPPSFIAMRATDPRRARWRVTGQRLHADCDDITKVRFTRDETNPGAFSPEFKNALVKLLAHHFAPGFTRSQNRAAIKLEEYEAAIEAAALSEGLEAHGRDAFEHDWAGGVYHNLSRPPGGYYGFRIVSEGDA